MIEIIPAIDIINGKCVRLSQGDFTRVKTYSDDPVSVALRFEDCGLKRVHMVDLDGAKRGSITNLKVLEAVAKETDLKIDFGGGLKSEEDFRRVFDAGASIATVGSLAVTDPNLLLRMLHLYGPSRILLGADVRGVKLAINGWHTDTDLHVIPFLSAFISDGGEQAFVTDIGRDGLLRGPSTALYTEIVRKVPALKLIASGGVGSARDIDKLERIGCQGVIIGKAIYEGTISLADLTARNRPIAALQ